MPEALLLLGLCLTLFQLFLWCWEEEESRGHGTVPRCPAGHICIQDTRGLWTLQLRSSEPQHFTRDAALRLRSVRSSAIWASPLSPSPSLTLGAELLLCPRYISLYIAGHSAWPVSHVTSVYRLLNCQALSPSCHLPAHFGGELYCPDPQAPLLVHPPSWCPMAPGHLQTISMDRWDLKPGHHITTHLGATQLLCPQRKTLAT
jgi:hypothetical protein